MSLRLTLRSRSAAELELKLSGLTELLSVGTQFGPGLTFHCEYAADPGTYLKGKGKASYSIGGHGKGEGHRMSFKRASEIR